MPTIMNIMPKRARQTSETVAQRGRKPRSNVVAVLAYDGVSIFELGIAVEMFGLLNAGSARYRVVVCADRPGLQLSANGVNIVADAGLEALQRAGTIIVPGWCPWPRSEARPSEQLLSALKRGHARGARIASICAGVFVLAAAGLVDGRRVTAHWASAEALAQRYPRVRVDPDVLYVDDGDIMTSAGRAAGLDLCLHIIRRDYGAEIANQVARRFVIAPHRDGGQAQFIQRPVQREGDPLTHVFDWAGRHLTEDLSIECLAARARMSRRTFIRRFEEATGCSPGEWVLQARVGHARELLEMTELSIEDVATSVGFGSADTLRHHFRMRMRTTPHRYRATFRVNDRKIGLQLNVDGATRLITPHSGSAHSRRQSNRMLEHIDR
jgi:AraC family transcriptional regulator, transcriptional activator FtrA